MRVLCAAVLLLLTSRLDATIIGQSEPAQSVTRDRVALLPVEQRAAWMAYLERSERQMVADRAALAAERAGMSAVPPLPKEGSTTRSVPLTRAAEWYRSDEARHIADVIVSFQTPAGGWSKNLDLSKSLRAKGQSYTANNLSKFLGQDDFDTPRDPQWNYVGTLDNDATLTEMLYLAAVADAVPEPTARSYRGSFIRGVQYLLAAQYPNGGWPQVWPLEGGYHDAITFNDDAMVHAMKVLTAVVSGKDQFRFVPAALRQQATAAVERGVQCILASQVVLHGQKTIWGQQHDALTLRPVAGRNFEPAALASAESTGLLEYLKSLLHPTDETRGAIQNGVQWLRARGVAEILTNYRNEQGVASRGIPPVSGRYWARFYSLETETAIFGDRDKSIHTDVAELSAERKKHYAWYTGRPDTVAN